MRRGILLPKMETSSVLKEDIAYYYRLMTDGKPPTFEWLRDRMEASTLRTDLKDNREKQEHELHARHAAPARAAPDKQQKKKKKKQKGEQERGNPKEESSAAPAPQTKGKGKGKKHGWLYHFSTCTRDVCSFNHDNEISKTDTDELGTGGRPTSHPTGRISRN